MRGALPPLCIVQGLEWNGGARAEKPAATLSLFFVAPDLSEAHTTLNPRGGVDALNLRVVIVWTPSAG